MNIRSIIIFSTLFVFLNLPVFGQENIEKKVQVVKAYKPKIQEAYKITELPKITDTTTTETEFNYYLLSKSIETEFEVEPIPAATMVGEPLNKLYPRYLKVGMGSKLSPLVEFSISTKRNENRSLGAYFQHRSSGGKVPLRNNERVFAGYSDNKLKLFGKQMFENAVLKTDFDMSSNTRYFYGYNTSIDTTLDKGNIKQNFLRLNALANFSSTYMDSVHLNYDLDLKYDYIEDNFDSKENTIAFEGTFNKFIDQNIVGLNTGFNYLDYNTQQDTGSKTLFHFEPWIAKFGDEWKVRGGVNFIAEAVNGNTKIRIYPEASMEYDIIDQYIIPYAGIDGKIDMHSYYQTTQKNPFILPGLNLENTNKKMIFYAGIKGNLSSSTYYNTRVKYSYFDHMPFFINNTSQTDSLGNQFDVVYDDGEYLNLYGEISFEFSEDITLSTRGNLYQYTLYNEGRAWQKPIFDLTISGRYNMRDKIIFNTDLFISGKRWAKYGEKGDAMELDGFVDLNLGIEYRYSKVLSGYLNINNILSDNYSEWNLYPVYGLHAFLGISYAF